MVWYGARFVRLVILDSFTRETASRAAPACVFVVSYGQIVEKGDSKFEIQKYYMMEEKERLHCALARATCATHQHHFY